MLPVLEGFGFVLSGFLLSIFELTLITLDFFGLLWFCLIYLFLIDFHRRVGLADSRFVALFILLAACASQCWFHFIAGHNYCLITLLLSRIFWLRWICFSLSIIICFWFFWRIIRICWLCLRLRLLRICWFCFRLILSWGFYFSFGLD